MLFPIFSLKKRTEFVIKRAEKFGGNISFSNYEDVETAFKNKELFPLDLKAGVTDALNEFLEPIRKKFQDPTLIQLTNNAYPQEKVFSLFSFFEMDNKIKIKIKIQKKKKK